MVPLTVETFTVEVPVVLLIPVGILLLGAVVGVITWLIDRLP